MRFQRQKPTNFGELVISFESSAGSRFGPRKNKKSGRRLSVSSLSGRPEQGSLGGENGARKGPGLGRWPGPRPKPRAARHRRQSHRPVGTPAPRSSNNHQISTTKLGRLLGSFFGRRRQLLPLLAWPILATRRPNLEPNVGCIVVWRQSEREQSHARLSGLYPGYRRPSLC
jgi:hypothetical protein